MQIEVFADPTCPWCLVGWKALGRALEARPGHERQWRPYLLYPRMPKAGVDRAQLYRERAAGDPERFAAIRAALIDAAAAAGAPIDLDKPKIMSQVLDAQRLILWASGQGRGEAMADAVLEAFWREGADIGADAVLAEIAARVGLDPALVRELLAGEADADTIHAQHAAAQRAGISGVPVTLYGRALATMGAQSVEQHLAAIDAALAQASAKTTSS